jgi:hypothetical protein
MNKYLLPLLITLALKGSHVFAQNHFIYIQSETRQPFTVTVNDKQFNSTGSGYVIIPRLKSGQYDLNVKFKDAKIPESRFTSVVDKKDVGYTLNAVGNSTIGLIDMQTYATLSATPVDTYAKNDKNAGSNTKTESEKNNTTAKTTTNTGRKPIPKKESNPSSATVKLKSGINKISEVKGANNVSLLYIDVRGNSYDTIDVVIPTQKEEAFVPKMDKFSNENSIFKWASADQNGDEDELIHDFQSGYNRKCVHLLTNEDYARLRRRMAAQSNETKMIEEALKISKKKCFTTLQVKKLSALFPKDHGKYKLFAALYDYVYDYVAYPTLEKEFSDVSYANKLQAMVSN